MPATGIEPVLYCYNRILSPARLPVPPRRQTQIGGTQRSWEEPIYHARAPSRSDFTCERFPTSGGRISFNGTNRARTYDPLLVRQMLSQLSYDPMYK